MKQETYKRTDALLILLNGILCLIFARNVTHLLPTFCGGILIIKGGLQFYKGIINQDYRILEQTDLVKSFSAIAVGIGIFFAQEDALFIIAIFWGLTGLTQATGCLNTALFKMARKEKFFWDLFKGLVEFSLSMAVIFNPFNSVEHHVLLLGIDMIFEGVISFLARAEKSAEQSD
ncbi:DUF308 domain-containing protein [Eubacterium sp.]|uniref:DUF308 domain-containing protein n=1 Tax=Eubacterium sp. TaxID=142586 RepID=UPI002FCA6184